MTLSRKSLLSGTYSWFFFISRLLLTLHPFSLTLFDFVCFVGSSRCAQMLLYESSFWLALLTFLSRVESLGLSMPRGSNCPTVLGVVELGVLAQVCAFFFSLTTCSSIGCLIGCLKRSGDNIICIRCSSCLFSLLAKQSSSFHVSVSALLFFLPLW